MKLRMRRKRAKGDAFYEFYKRFTNGVLAAGPFLIFVIHNFLIFVIYNFAIIILITLLNTLPVIRH